MLVLDTWTDLSAVVDFLAGLALWVWIVVGLLLVILGIWITYRTPRQPRDTINAAGNASVSLWRPVLRALGRIFFP